MQEVFFNKILPLTLLQGFERVIQGLRVRGSWRSNINCNILTPKLWPSRCVFLVLLMVNRRSRGHSAGWWLSSRHLISIFSGPQLIRAQRPLRPDVAFPTTFLLQLSGTLLATPTGTRTPELYNGSTSTRSLKSHVWSSSSGNNCHAVHRSLSSGASVYECTMGIFLARPISSANFCLHDFLS